MATTEVMLGGGGQARADELGELVQSLEEDEGVARLLDSMPLPSSEAGGAIMYRDADDVLTINRQSWTTLILAVLLACSTVGNVLMYVRRPQLVVVDKASGQTLYVNDREVGSTPSVEVGPDELRDEQKLFLVKNFLQGVFGMTQAVRGRQMDRVFKMMEPDSALTYARWLAEKRVLDTQAEEGWEGTWTVEEKNITLDEREPMIVNVVGEWKIRRMKGGSSKPVERTVLMSVRVLLRVSTTKPKRNDNNLQTGFSVVKFKTKTLNETEESPFILMASNEQ